MDYYLENNEGLNNREKINMEISTYKVKVLKTNKSYKNYFYIIIDIKTNQAVIIDPAWEYNLILEELEFLKVEVKAILLTHSHSDHTNLVKDLVDKFNPVVYMSKIEIDYYDFNCKNIQALNDMEVISVGNTNIISIHTPGHTKGSMCYLLSKTLFTGDTIFIEGCGACYGKGGSSRDMFDSIQKIKRIVKPEVLVFSGHSYGKEPGIPISNLMEENIYFLLQDKELFVNYRDRENQKNLLSFK